MVLLFFALFAVAVSAAMFLLVAALLYFVGLIGDIFSSVLSLLNK
jgi:hypothetical protein